jgi:sterol desaturase/sphingolipid hydroxylase (fatty acid hydroxylase superfamily)
VLFWVVAGGLAVGIVQVLYVILTCCVIERFSVLERYPLAARIPGIMMNLAQVALSAALIWPIARLWDLLGVAPFITIPLWRWLAPLGVAGLALQWLVVLMVSDFLVYWRHRAEHKWFWPIHVVHHSPAELHAANDIGHPAQVWIHALFVSIPLSLIQFDGPATPAVILFLVTLSSYYIHSPVDLHFGPLRKLLVDNRFHRIHHSLEERHFDKNFGICFSIWDRLFGTAYDPAPDEWPSVGVAGVAPPRSLADYVLLPFRVSGGQRGEQRREPWLTSANSSPRS